MGRVGSNLGNANRGIKMRYVVVLGVSLLALAGCQKKTETAAATGDAAPAASGGAPALTPLSGPPKRKPGLWTQTVVSGDVSQSTKVCLDEATEAKMSVWGQQANEEMCGTNKFSRTLTGMTFESVCDLGAMGKVATKGDVTGDFNTKYVIKATSTTTGSSMAQANKTDSFEMTGTWEGACPANMKPGDMALPGGVTVNINQLAAMKK